MSGKVVKVSGPLVVAEGLFDANISDIVYIGRDGLIGEIFAVGGGRAAIRPFESMCGIGPGSEVSSSDSPLSVELGPGLIGNIFDGIQRPLRDIREFSGAHIPPGASILPLNRDKIWEFKALAAVGDVVSGGFVIGTVRETPVFLHKIMVPPGVSGTVESIESGDFTVSDVICKIRLESGALHELQMMQKWPVRTVRPYARKFTPNVPLRSGTHMIDRLFPVFKGGTATLCGASGTGKTALLSDILKRSDADVVVHIGCGGRAAETAGAFKEFFDFHDARTVQPLINRAVFVSGSSDTSAAIREASLHTGVAIAEYFRDMGYDVALAVDSLSRWAEALREISATLGEMPCEEGYPPCLSSRIAQVYGRAGAVECAGNDRRGSLTAVCALSSSGGNASDPALQAAIRASGAFWSLDSRLADTRFFPAIDCLESYSLYADECAPQHAEGSENRFAKDRDTLLSILREEAKILDGVRLFGTSSLSASDRITLETSKMIREDLLRQDGSLESRFAPDRQEKTLDIIFLFDGLCRKFSEKICGSGDLLHLATEAREKIRRLKTAPAEELSAVCGGIKIELEEEIKKLCGGECT
jgi:V/A-type H+-transporting ATPase subunit A